METDSANSVGRLQLFIRDEAVSKGLIQPGHYGIPESDEKVTDLGVSVDLMPLARRPKAIDMTDMEALVISYDMESEEFKRIAAESGSHCQYGPSFLVFERSTGRFLEFFCGNKSSRIEAKKIFPFLPLTQADIDAKAMAGNDVSYLKPHGPIPVTLTVMVPENRRGTWYVPVVARCSSTFDIPLDSSVVSEKITEFIMAGWEWSLDKIAQEENRITKPRASRQIKTSATPAKDEWTSTRKTRKATAQVREPPAETYQNAKPAEGQRGSRPGKGKNRKVTPTTYPVDGHAGVASGGELSAAPSENSIRGLLDDVDSIVEHLQGVREKLSRLVRPAEKPKRRLGQKNRE